MRDSVHIRSNLEDFVQVMENRLKEKDETHGVNTWLSQDPYPLLDKLNEKHKELKNHIIHYQNIDSRIHTRLALIDLANRCFMLWDRIK